MLEVFDLDRKKTAILQNAFDRTEGLEMNAVPSFTFTLPGDDDKNQYCKPFHYVRNDNGPLYRIIAPATTKEETETKTYRCEGVIATLIDDVIFGQCVIGNLGTYTRDVIEYILSLQHKENWVLDECDFSRQFEYGFENENLLAALFSVPNQFTEPYMWSYDTSSYPWKLSLKKIDATQAPQFYIRAEKNLLSFAEERAAEEVCTKLYCLGYGEGVNQLTIADVNNGVPYLLAPQEKINEYGLITRILVDRRYENAESLMAYGQKCLDELQDPTSAKTFSVADLYELTNDELDKAEIGKIARFTGDGTTTYITAITRNYDVPGDMQITLATKACDVASTIADLADRQRIEQVYSQGATQIYAQSIQANATSDVAAKLNFYIPSEMRIVNAVKVKISLSAFRSYSKATDSNSQTTKTTSEGGSTTQTTTSGGSTTQTTTSGGSTTQTTTSGGSTTQSTTSGGSTTKTTTSGGSQTVTSASGGGSTSSSVTLTASNTTATDSGGVGSANHNHGISKGTYLAVTNSSYSKITGKVTWVPSGAHTHAAHSHTIYSLTHSVTIGSHTHSVTIGSHSHSVTIPSHTHSVTISSHSHSVTIPSHTHSVTIPKHTHTVTIPAHSHTITQGIFTFGSPSSASLYVNGDYQCEVTEDEEMDITAYLTKNGTIPRGSWHSIEVKPNDKAYVTIDMMIQGFIQSRGDNTV